MIADEYRAVPTVVEVAFGRAFYAEGSRVYFSRLIDDDLNSLGRCYQVNDPTSDNISDLLPTDGGEITVDGAQGINRLVRYLSGVLVFARNGVWYLSGPSSGFTATAYSLQKITTFGLYADNSVVSIGPSVLYMSDSAIHQISTNDQGNVQESDITTATIKTYYSTFVSTNVYSVYSLKRKEVWMTDPFSGKALVFDTRTGGMYPQKFEFAFSVYGGVGTADSFLLNAQKDSLLHTTTPDSRTFKDFGQYAIPAYMVTWPETLGKFSHVKAISSCTVVMNKTEETITNFIEANQKYVFDYPGSCVFTAMWDHDNTNAFKRHTTPMDVYRVYRRGFIPTSYPTPLGDGQTIIASKFPVSGSGSAVQFKFEAEEGKDMQVLGYSVDFKMKGRQ